MADLVQEFFNRDLSETEQESLSHLLESSPDAALSYEKRLEQSYLATGLPLPSLPNSLQTPPSWGGSGSTAWSGATKLLLLMVAAGGMALWKYWPATQAEMQGQFSQTQQTEVKKPALSLKQALNKPVPVMPQPADSAREGQELSVVVNSPQRSLVTVRVLDAAGREVRVLYTGFIETGKWHFDWDGLLGDGEAAEAGNYRIDVQTGESHMLKDIRIKTKAADR